MNNDLKCQSLFAFNSILIKKIFSLYQYPWEILPHLKQIIEEVIKEGLDGYTHLAENILVGKGAKIDKNAHIDGPCIIGKGAEIRHGAYIRGSVILGDGCVIGNSSEVKNSIMMKRAQAPHFNYVGDSILGERAHLGAGSICSNLRSDGKNVKIRLENTSLDTGLRKFGAILGDGAEIGCGAVLCPGTVIGKNTTVYPLAMTRGFYPCDSIVKHNGIMVKKTI